MGYTGPRTAMRTAVEQTLKQVAAMLALHEGGVELVDVDEAAGQVTLRLTGTCAGCALSSITLKQGIEVALCEAVPGIRSIVALT